MFSLSGFIKLLVFLVLLSLFTIDVIKKELPDKLNLVLIILILMGIFFKIDGFNNITYFESLLGLIIGGGFFFLIYFFTGAMGGGDVKLVAVLGVLLGPIHIMLLTFLSFVSGAIISIGLITMKIKGKKDEIPFGPFIILSFFVTYYWGDEIISFYLNLIT
jgi:leader peptidase (prepilin peptidase)/N-methyltransferase